MINDQFPGPLINVTEGDTVVVRVMNMAPRDSITIHFHGLSMRDTPMMDGAAGFTQVGDTGTTSFLEFHADKL